MAITILHMHSVMTLMRLQQGEFVAEGMNEFPGYAGHAPHNPLEAPLHQDTEVHNVVFKFYFVSM